jgi:hypothetical protein
VVATVAHVDVVEEYTLRDALPFVFVST